MEMMRKVAVFVALSILALVVLRRLAQNSFKLDESDQVFRGSTAQNGFEFKEEELETEDSLGELYERWSRYYEVSRDPSEKQMRINLFKEKAKYVLEFNKKGAPYELELNIFGDMTESEVQSIVICSSPSDISMEEQQKRGYNDFNYHDKLKEIPSSFDWRERDAVTSVKNQGGCGCCWAFSAVTAIEGINKIMTGELLNLSVQQVVACDKLSSACYEGKYTDAFKYIINIDGITTEDNYPYTSGELNQTYKNLTCHSSKVLPPLVTINDYGWITPNNEFALKEAVFNQPISVNIDARSVEFRFYKKGIFTGPCETNLTHSVTIVGYGTDTKTVLDYWIVKNSWGANWGREGYIYMQRGIYATGLCGIAKQPWRPIKSSSNISSVRAASSLEDEL